MIVFKTYFKILKKYKFVVLLYIGILLGVSLFSLKSQNPVTSFSESKPKIAIINLDGRNILTDHFENYIKKNADKIELENDRDQIMDAIFYQQVSAVIYLHDGYEKDFLTRNQKPVETKYANDYNASYAKIMIERYFDTLQLIKTEVESTEAVLELMNQTLTAPTKVEMNHQIDTASLANASYYFSFANYSILAACIYITAIVLLRFQDSKIKKRNIVSSTNMKKITKQLYLGNGMFCIAIWAGIILLSFLLVGKEMFSIQGALFMLNSLIFMTCALAIGFLIGNLLKSENVVSSIVTVVSLGSSFICGSFVPLEYLPLWVRSIAKIFPSYWYISNNKTIEKLERIEWFSFMEVLTPMIIVGLFTVFFLFMTNKVVQRRRTN